MTLVVGAALLYHAHKLSPIVDLDLAKERFEGEEFRHSPFSCFEDMEICCWSCWCSGVRWADTMNAVGLFSFWAAILTYLVICLLETCTGGITVWVLVALFFTTSSSGVAASHARLPRKRGKSKRLQLLKSQPQTVRR